MKGIGVFLQKIRNGIEKIVAWNATPYITVALISCCLLFPFYWIFITSFKPAREIFQWPPTLFPWRFTFSNYKSTLAESPIPLYIANSAMYSLLVAAFIVTIGTITTYGLSIYPYKGSNKVAFMFFATRIVPPQSLWLPFIIFFGKIGLVNTRGGVIIYEIILVYPLCIWMLKGIFDAFPRELVDSASIDGSSRLGTLFRIIMPVIAPGIAAVAIIAFLWTWNEFMFPFLILNNESLHPITVGIYYFVGDEGIKWGPMAASGGLTILPGLIFFIIAQRHIVEGLSKGAIK
jgi:multiple sugar transport system permease protein